MNVVELQHCVELKDRVYMATKVESQIKRRGSTRVQTNSTSSSSTLRLKLKREGVVQPKSYMHANAEPPKTKKDAYTNGKGKSDEGQSNTNRNHADDPLEVPIGPIIRVKAKKLKETLNGLVQNIWS